MNGARRFFSDTGSPADGNASEGGGIRAGTESAGTRLRQKPATGAAAPHNLFASLGMDTTSRDRIGSSTIASSNHGYNSGYSSTSMRPSSAVGTGSSALPSSSSAWRPPSIGGLRVTPPPPPMPAVGSLSVASLNRSGMTSTTASATTTSVSRGELSGTGLPLGTATKPSDAAAKTSARSTQLFSIEDAEELYSDDGWNCDSPSTVLSNPTDETEPMSTTVPVRGVAAEPGDEFAWGDDDDDVFASPVVKAIKTPPHANETSGGGAFETKVESTMHQAAPLDVDSRFAAKSSTATQVPSHGTKPRFEQAQTMPVALLSAAAMPSTSFSAITTNFTSETADHSHMQMSTHESGSALERTRFESTPPSTTVSSTFFPAKSTYNALKTTSYEAPFQATPSVQASIPRAPYQQDEQRDNDLDYQEPADTGSETMVTTSSTFARTAAVTTTTGSFVTPPVELTSPGGAAGEFWGDGDEDELFDHDKPADEEWDESMKDSKNELEGLDLSFSDDKCRVESTTLASSSEDSSFLLPYQPPSLEVSANREKSISVAQEAMSASNYFVSGHVEEVKSSSQEEKIDQLTEGTKVSTIDSSIKLSPSTRLKTQGLVEPLHSVENNRMVKQQISLDTEGSPFSSATLKPASQENDPNVFSEAPHSARFLHTPTGTGGPFGRVSSPQGNENSAFPEVISGATEAGYNSMAFASGEKGEVPDSYTESSVRWDPRLLHEGGRVEMSSGELANEVDGETRHNTHHKPNDEEERDSVVSFSGENSYFPSTGRPSSLYGGSQSSFASHRMYQSSIASTDHEGSSIASFGVSSAGATFGGSERVSEGGAFSDGTVSETPSMVDSSNASTAFGTDFPSVSEGQFSAPGTTIGGSDNASDGEFSDDNASETRSLCGSVNTNPRFVSEFNSSSGHCVTETVEHCGTPEPFALSAPECGSESVETIGESATAAATPIFGGDDTSSDANLFESSPSVLSSQHAFSALPATMLASSSYNVQSENTVQEDNVQSAASLFGTTAGADVPNPFGSFGVLPAVTGVKTIDEHELPTLDAEDLFGSGPSSSSFESSFARPAQSSYSSNYPTHDQNYEQAGSGSESATQTSALNFAQSQLSFSNSNDRPPGGESILNPFQSQRSSNYNRADPFASRGAQLCFDSSALSAEGMFGDGGNNGKPSVDCGVSSYFDGNAQHSANDVIGRSSSSVATGSGHFGQQSNIHSASHGGGESYNPYGHSATTAYSEKASVVAPNHERSGAYTETNSLCAQPHGHSGNVAAEECTTTSGEFGPSGHQSATNSFTSNTTPREASGFGGQNHLGRSASGTPNKYSQQAVAAALSSASQAQQSYGSPQIGQRSTPETAPNYNHHSTAKVFGRASTAQSSYSGLQESSYPHYGKTAAHGPAGGFGNQLRSSSSASTDAFFGRSSAADSVSSATDIGVERVRAPSSESTQQQPVQQQPPALAGSQPSFLQSGSNASSYAKQHSNYFSVTPTAMRPSMQPRDLNTSRGSIEDIDLSRRGSSSSMSRYGSDAFSQPQRNMQQQKGSISARPSVDANIFFGAAFTVTNEKLSSGFVPQFASQSHQERDLPHERSQRETSGEYSGATTAAFQTSAVEAIPRTDFESPNEIPPARCDEKLQQHEANSTGGSLSVFTKADTQTASTTETLMSTIATENDVDRPQPFDGFSSSHSTTFSGETSSDFVSSSSAPPTKASLSYQFEHKECGQQPEQIQYQARDDAAASPQFAHSTLSNDEGSVYIPGGHSGSYFDSRVPVAGAISSVSHSQQQHQQQSQSFQEQQRSQLHHAVTEYGYCGGAAQRQQHGTGYNTADKHEYGTATGHGCYGRTITQQASRAAPTSVVKTSNKYKNTCVAPPSCLASFGFGGNVVTMFPKRKLKSNIVGSSFCNTSRGAPVPSEFDDADDGVLCKGPVNVYRMEQLHPKNSEFELMDIFPGPLTEDVSDEAILEYLDDCLKRSEASISADEAEEENDRLLLGVLRVLVKCNGKLRSDPGMLNPNDPDSPEAQLIALLSESSKLHRNEHPTFPLPRKVQSAMPSGLMLKHANDLRELLLIGNRKDAVSFAMTAQMWPEAMLIASFTDKDEYKRVLCTYLDEHYALGDPCRALFMSFADQQEKSVQEPKRLLQTNVQQPAGSLILSSWVSHVQVLLSNRTADTNKILTELGDRLWSEVNAVAAAHTCYLLAGIQVDAPTSSSKMALLGGDHRTPAEARFYVSPGAVQRTEIYEWARKHAKDASGNLMIPFQGYKLIYAMLLADHGKLDMAFKYVTSMLTVIKAVTATMKPGASMYLDGMKNQLTVLDDRLRQHLGQDRVATVAAATSRDGGRKQGGKWGLGSALSIMGKIVNRVVEGNELGAALPAGPSASTPGGLYANEAIACAENYPSTPCMTAPTLSPTSSYPQQRAQKTPPPSLHGPSPIPAGFNGHATPPVSQSNSSDFLNGHNRASATPPAGPYSRPGVTASGPFSGNGRPTPEQQQQSTPFANNGHFAPQQQQSSPGSFSENGTTGPFSNSGQGSQTRGMAPLMRPQHSIEPPGSNHSTHSNSSFSGMTPQYSSQQQRHNQQYQPPSSQTSQHSHGTPPARPSFQKSPSLDVSGDTSFSSQPETTSGSAAEPAASLPPTDVSNMSGPASDKGKASPKVENMKKSGRSKTPPLSGSAKGSGWLSGLSSFIVTKMNPEAKVAKLGEQMEAYFDENAKRWVFPGEPAPEEAAKPSAPPTGPLPGSAPGSSATGIPPAGANSAPGSISSGPALSNDPLAALMAPPPSHILMKKDPLAAMMVPPSRPGMYGGGSMAQRKPPRPQFAVFKPTAASKDEQGG